MKRFSPPLHPVHMHHGHSPPWHPPDIMFSNPCGVPTHRLWHRHLLPKAAAPGH